MKTLSSELYIILKKYENPLLLMTVLLLTIATIGSSGLTSFVGIFLSIPLQIAIFRQRNLTFKEFRKILFSSIFIPYLFFWFLAYSAAGALSLLAKQLMPIYLALLVTALLYSISYTLLGAKFFKFTTGKIASPSSRYSFFIFFVLTLASLLMTHYGVSIAGENGIAVLTAYFLNSFLFMLYLCAMPLGIVVNNKILQQKLHE